MQRLVLDTNVVLDLLHFNDPGIALLADALKKGCAVVLSDSRCHDELRRVLAYPDFALDEGAQALLMRKYAALCLTCETTDGARQADIPLCSDPDDQKFLELALRGNAAYLITKDKALLCMARRVKRLFAIASPADYTTPTT
jgi:putative PIN family toxin of toxin-antitoxin system